MSNSFANICSRLPVSLYSFRPQGVVVTKAPLVNFSVSKIFDATKVPVTFFESHSYLTGVYTAELPRYLSNMNVVFNS